MTYSVILWRHEHKCNFPRHNILSKVQYYQSFLNELSPVLTHLQKYNDEIILPGNLNINLLKENQRPIINDFFDIMMTNSIFPHIALPTRLSEKSGSLIDNFYCKFITLCIWCIGLYSNQWPIGSFPILHFNKHNVSKNAYKVCLYK